MLGVRVLGRDMGFCAERVAVDIRARRRLEVRVLGLGGDRFGVQRMAVNVWVDRIRFWGEGIIVVKLEGSVFGGVCRRWCWVGGGHFVIEVRYLPHRFVR